MINYFYALLTQPYPSSVLCRATE